MIAETKDELMRASILDAAQKLFQQYGLSKTTMEDIAREVGKGKSSLYYYYTKKEEIFAAVVLKEKEDVLHAMEQAIDNEPTAAAKLKAFARTKFRVLRKKKVLFKIVINDMRENPCMIQEMRQSVQDTELQVIRRIVQFGIVNGEFRKVESEQLDLMCYIAVTTLRGIELDALLNDNTPQLDDPGRVMEVTIDMLLRAFGK